MKSSRLLFAFVLIAAFTGLIILFIGGLGKDPRQLDSLAEGKTLTEDTQIHFNLPDLYSGQMMTIKEMPSPPYLINVWGSWCPACHIEHPYLMTLSQKIPIIGINWAADNPNEAEDAKKMLAQSGNPYQHVLFDKNGSLIIDLGVYGAPETFLIGKNEKILKRYAGPLDEQVWQREFQPLLEQDK